MMVLKTNFQLLAINVRQFLEEKLKRHRALSLLLGLDESSDHYPKDADKNFNAKFLNIKETFGQQCSIVSTHALFLQAAISMLAYQEAIGNGADKYWASPASEAIVQTVKHDRGWTREKLQGLGLVADVFYGSPRYFCSFAHCCKRLKISPKTTMIKVHCYRLQTKRLQSHTY